MLFFFYRVKFVGLFIILFVGMVTIKDLWDIYGNVQNSLVSDSLCLLSRIRHCTSHLPLSSVVCIQALHGQSCLPHSTSNAHLLWDFLCPFSCPLQKVSLGFTSKSMLLWLPPTHCRSDLRCLCVCTYLLTGALFSLVAAVMGMGS